MKYLFPLVITGIAFIGFILFNHSFHPNKDLLGHKAYINKKPIQMHDAVKSLSIAPSQKQPVPIKGPDFLINRIAEVVHKEPSELTEPDLLHITSLFINISENHTPFDISLISSMKNLSNLSVYGSNFKKIDFLTKLPHLKDLSLSNNQLKEPFPLPNNFGKLSNLDSLYLNHVKGNSLNQLATLTTLKQLSISDSHMTTLKPLEHLSGLINLNLFNDHIQSIASLSGCKNLVSIQLINNDIKKISSLSKLLKVQTLLLNGNHISDITPLKGLPNLHVLSLEGNPIGDISPLKQQHINELVISRTKVDSLNTVKTLKHLRRLDMNGLSITSVKPLSDLPNLHEVYLDKNKVTDWKWLKAKKPHLVIGGHPTSAY